VALTLSFLLFCPCISVSLFLPTLPLSLAHSLGLFLSLSFPISLFLFLFLYFSSFPSLSLLPSLSFLSVSSYLSLAPKYLPLSSLISFHLSLNLYLSSICYPSFLLFQKTKCDNFLNFSRFIIDHSIYIIHQCLSTNFFLHYLYFSLASKPFIHFHPNTIYLSKAVSSLPIEGTSNQVLICIIQSYLVSTLFLKVLSSRLVLSHLWFCLGNSLEAVFLVMRHPSMNEL
jgi:hypothetical protein